LHQASDDVNTAASHQLFAVDLVTSDKIPDESQKSGDVEALLGLTAAFQKGDQSVDTPHAVDRVFDVLKTNFK
jgi:hypothetical protein